MSIPNGATVRAPLDVVPEIAVRHDASQTRVLSLVPAATTGMLAPPRVHRDIGIPPRPAAHRVGSREGEATVEGPPSVRFRRRD